MARPSKYTPELVEEICDRLSKGEPLAAICRSDERFPHPSTVRDWSDSNESVSLLIARAREDGEDFLAAQCLQISDTPLEGIETTTKADGAIEEKRGDMLGHRKLQIETRLKLLAKWNPKKYGERQQVEHSGEVSLVSQLQAARERAAKR